jgi:predicted flap endonuclease-1-like 5' DNA nuclease
MSERRVFGTARNQAGQMTMRFDRWRRRWRRLLLRGMPETAVRTMRSGREADADASGRRPAAGFGPDPALADDLTLIDGIGMATDNRLRRAGIKTFADLARSDPDELVRRLDMPAGGRGRVCGWILEAQRRHDAGGDAL